MDYSVLSEEEWPEYFVYKKTKSPVFFNGELIVQTLSYTPRLPCDESKLHKIKVTKDHLYTLSTCFNPATVETYFRLKKELKKIGVDLKEKNTDVERHNLYKAVEYAVNAAVKDKEKRQSYLCLIAQIKQILSEAKDKHGERFCYQAHESGGLTSEHIGLKIMIFINNKLVFEYYKRGAELAFLLSKLNLFLTYV